MTTKFDEVCTAAAAKLIEAIEGGADGEWTMPWHSPSGFPIPTNALTGDPYRGGNWLLASVAGFANEWSSGCWATYKQWQALGRQIPKGASGIGLVRWVKPKKRVRKPTDAGDDDDQASRRIPFRFTVFAAEQLLADDRAPWQLSTEQTTTMLDPEQRQPKLDAWMASTGANIIHGRGRAFYVAGETDEIHLPGPAQWREWSKWGDYYATAGHELVHWTGHESRLGRPRIAGVDRTEEAQAFEELIAEFGSAMLGQHFDFIPSRRADHLGYLSHWAAQLKADPRTLWRAASSAQKAVAHLMSHSREAPDEVPHDEVHDSGGSPHRRPTQDPASTNDRFATNDDRLCYCGHSRGEHADPSTGDSRCLMIAPASELAATFDDGRDGELAYCACLEYAETDASPSRWPSESHPNQRH